MEGHSKASIRWGPLKVSIFGAATAADYKTTCWKRISPDFEIFPVGTQPSELAESLSWNSLEPNRTVPNRPGPRGGAVDNLKNEANPCLLRSC